ncbi:hypothetical protein CC86DRAFT_369076 [Ophiobolus disseminans]|uniref:Uncharacterized protein n=1 Tax=Ophiobolus disseminans TaxID=1469910 RepID=A0A6A7A3F6_9PLEO|nr:hypothetical protein CC86DRAFT_369076 [Ophiobolus disseminans]
MDEGMQQMFQDDWDQNATQPLDDTLTEHNEANSKQETETDQAILKQYEYEMTHSGTQCGFDLDAEENDIDIADEDLAQRKKRDPVKQIFRYRQDTRYTRDLDIAQRYKNLPLIDIWEAVGKKLTEEEIAELDWRAVEKKSENVTGSGNSNSNVSDDGKWPPIVQAYCDGRSGPAQTAQDREEMAKAALMPLPDDDDVLPTDATEMVAGTRIFKVTGDSYRVRKAWRGSGEEL